MGSKAMLWAIGLVLGVAVVASQAQVTLGQMRVGTMNIQVFGTTKAANQPVMDTLVRILRRYDLIAIQEIRDASNTAFPTLMNQLNAAVAAGGDGTHYSYVIGSRQGRTSSKEQYAFIYEDRKLQVRGATYEFPVELDRFERPPFAAAFVPNTTFWGAAAASSPPLVMVNIHTKPTNATYEIDALYDAATAIADVFQTTNLMILGDYNAGCSYVPNSQFANIRLYTDTARFRWLIANGVDTMASSDCSYDRLVMGLAGASSATPGTGAAAPSNMTQMFNASSAEPFDYEAAWGLNHTFVLTVSDHLPMQVWMNVLGASGVAAGSSTAGGGTGSGPVGTAGSSTGLNAAGSVGPNAWIVSAVLAVVMLFAQH